jgi:hypothetical protein
MRVMLSRHLFTLLQGRTFGDWRKLLWQNRYQVDRPYLPRAMFVASAALANSAHAGIDVAVYGRRVEATQVEPPLFILGHHRSGTTHHHVPLGLEPSTRVPEHLSGRLPAH